MTEIGGDEPVFLDGFARECLIVDSSLQSIAPATISDLEPFQVHRMAIVDVACKEESAGFYSGDHKERQNVELKFGDFVDYFCTSFRQESHWLSSVEGLQFNLCQCPIAVYKPDETCTGPVLPYIMKLFRIPDSLTRTNVSQVNLWMSVKPSRTGIHYDAYRNVLVVLHGQKTVTLYPPSQTKNLYPRPIYSRSSNHSAVDFVNPDFSMHPNFSEATPLVMAVPAGNAVYIPEGWWHQVDSDPFTIAINYWFDGFRDKLMSNRQMSVYYARVIMEDIVRKETSLVLQQLHNEHRTKAANAQPVSAFEIATHANTIEARESRLLSVTKDDMKRVQIELATQFPNGWKELLVGCSIDFAAFLTDYWDQVDDGASWIPSLFEALGEDADQIKHTLLTKHECFKQKICSQVLAAILGN